MKASVTLSGVVRFTNKVGGSVLIHATASADIFCEFIHPISAPIFPTSSLASFFNSSSNDCVSALLAAFEIESKRRRSEKSRLDKLSSSRPYFEYAGYLITTQRVIGQTV